MTDQSPKTASAPVETETPLTPADWAKAEKGLEPFLDRLQQRPKAWARYNEVLAEIREQQLTLQKLRTARVLTQTKVAEELHMDQSEVSKLERRSDMLVSTLRKFVEATGGQMHIVVEFPDGRPVELFVAFDEEPERSAERPAQAV